MAPPLMRLMRAGMENSQNRIAGDESAAKSGKISGTPKQTALLQKRSGNLGTFSEMVKSRPIAIEVGTEKTQIFHVHEDLLRAESDVYNAKLQSGEEKDHGTIFVMEEDPELYRSFISYLYRDKFGTTGIDDGSDLVLLARLYCMGNRLLAGRFQQAVFCEFWRKIEEEAEISVSNLCELLEVVFTELPEKGYGGKLETSVIRMATFRLDDLRRNDKFVHDLTWRLPEMTRLISLSLRPMSHPDGMRSANPEPGEPLPRFHDG